MTTNREHVFAGIDTHAKTHHVAVIDQLGGELGDQEFPATTAGYEKLLGFILIFGVLL